jgi:2-oxo-3-hexenedioate decarboxylase/2-keto-4-pentenoate hydratase
MSVPHDPSLITDRGRTIYGATPPGEATPCDRASPLTPAELAEVVELIAAGREQRKGAELPARLMTRDWPSVVQVVLRLDERLGRAPAGWKIGAASEEIRRAEGLPGPSPGRIYLDTVFTSPAALPAELFINFRNVECELAFRLGRGFALRSDPYTEAEVDAHIESLLPTLEIGDMVFGDWYGASGYFGSCLDNGGGAALVCGADVADWRGLDLPGTRLALSLNGTFVKEGFGRAAMGHPLTSLTWLVNWAVGNGREIADGEIVSTGTCTGHCFVAPGDSVRLDVDGIGAVEAFFET